VGVESVEGVDNPRQLVRVRVWGPMGSIARQASLEPTGKPGVRRQVALLPAKPTVDQDRRIDR